MSKQQKSFRSGASNHATTAPRQVTPSTDAASTLLPKSPPMSVTLDSTVQTNQAVDFQLTPNSQELTPNARKAKLLHALAAGLGALVVWKRVTLGGRQGWALFFDETLWVIDPQTQELTPYE